MSSKGRLFDKDMHAVKKPWQFPIAWTPPISAEIEIAASQEHVPGKRVRFSDMDML